MQVITPIALILNEVFNSIKEQYTDSVFKFDPNLSYEEVLKGVRALRHSLNIDDEKVFPLFAFSRTSLIPVEDLNRRHFPIEKDLVNYTAREFNARFCKFDLVFKLFSRDIMFMDTFEVMYCNHNSINSIKTVTVTLPEIGDFEYNLIWSELEDSEFNKENNFYQAVSFRTTLLGYFVTFEDVSVPLIAHIRGRVLNYNSMVLEYINVDADV